MKCNYCNSIWDSNILTNVCPFCGASLLNEETDNTVTSVLKDLINKNGPDILKNQKLVKAYLMDCVKGQDKEKKMFEFACTAGIAEYFCKTSELNDPQQRKIIVMKSISALKENAFMSEENAQQTVNIFLGAFGFVEERIAPYVSSENNTTVSSSKEDFDKDKKLVLLSTGYEKIKVIKAICQITGFGIADAKALAENTPSVILNNVTKDRAEHAKNNLEQYGAKAEITKADSSDVKPTINSSASAISQTISTPENEKLRQQLSPVRKKADDFEKRVLVLSSITIVLNKNGTVSATTVTDDKYGIYDHGTSEASKWNDIVSIHECEFDKERFEKTVLGLKSDGTVVATGDINCDITKLADIKEIYIDRYDKEEIFAIRNDGTVYSVFNHPQDYWQKFYCGQDKTDHFRDIKKILWTQKQIICLKKDGTLDATEFIGSIDRRWFDLDEIKYWRNIKKLYYITGRMVGIKDDGSLVATTRNTSSDDERYDYWNDIKNWRNIEMFYWGKDELVALTEYGNILYAQNPQKFDRSKSFFHKMKSWNNIAKLYFGVGVAAGLRLDGSVVVATSNNCEDARLWQSISGWRDLIGLIPGYKRIVGIKKDGSLIHVGKNDHGEGNVEKLNLLTAKTPDISSKSKSESFDDDQFYIMINDILKGRSESESENKPAAPTIQKKKFEVHLSDTEDLSDYSIEQLRKKVRDEKNNRSKYEIEMRQKRGVCQHCGGVFRGLFKKVCCDCGKPKDY